MPTKHPLFREIPPLSLVLELCQQLGLSTEFPVTFQREQLSAAEFSNAAALLEPYYIPCKAKQYLYDTDDHRWITILKHIFLPHAYVIVSYETTRNRKKTTFYTIQRAEGQLKEAISVDFS